LLSLIGIARNTAKASGHVVIQFCDIPITQGLLECIQAFETLDVEVGLKRILEESVPEPLIELRYRDEAEARFPAIAGGLCLALVRSFTIIDPERHPTTKEWERAFRILDLPL
jgi:hypothetical protein